MVDGGFTEAVRQELARVEVRGTRARQAELAGLLRITGSWHLEPGQHGPRLELRTRSGAVIRRAHRWVLELADHRPQLVVWSPSGVRQRTTYGLILPGAAALGTSLGVLDARGFPTDQAPTIRGSAATIAYLRGVALGGASWSPPGRDPHLEIGVDGAAVAAGIVALLAQEVDVHARVVEGPRRRVVVKSGDAIARLLAALGASQAFLTYDDRRFRRQLRADATRLANADGANLRRSIDASRGQVQAVEQAISRHGWEGLPDDLREVALARLANPEASLTELGGLLDPAVGKSAVHRRLRRLEELATSAATDEGPSSDS